MAEKKRTSCCKSKKGGSKFILGAALGAAVGAVAGVLVAPKSGKETRKDIKNGAVKADKKVKAGSKKLAAKGKKAVASSSKKDDKTTKKS